VQLILVIERLRLDVPLLNFTSHALSQCIDHYMQIYQVEEGGGVKLLCSNIILESDRPIRLHGGLVLGVTFDKKIRSGKAAT